MPRLARDAGAYQLYSFYEDVSGDQRPPPWVFDFEPPYRLSAIRLYDAARNPILQLEYNVGYAWIDGVDVVESGDARLLVVRIGHAGSGALWNYRAFRAHKGGWTPIVASPWGDDAPDGKGWAEDIAARLPPELAVWKGVLVDFATMTATTSLWRPDDANCCPTGGEAELRFAIVEDALRVVAMTYRPDG
ncbi:MAG: hypothetical protein WD673_06970 [Alphaproteobacteria bacterium]